MTWTKNKEAVSSEENQSSGENTQADSENVKGESRQEFVKNDDEAEGVEGSSGNKGDDGVILTEDDKAKMAQYGDSIKGKVIDLDEMVSQRNVRDSETNTDTSTCGRMDRFEFRKHTINFIQTSEAEFAKHAENFHRIRDAMINNLNENVNLINERYERRKAALFKMADENRQAMTDEQYLSTRYLQQLLTDHTK